MQKNDKTKIENVNYELLIADVIDLLAKYGSGQYSIYHFSRLYIELALKKQHCDITNENIDKVYKVLHNIEVITKSGDLISKRSKLYIYINRCRTYLMIRSFLFFLISVLLYQILGVYYYGPRMPFHYVIPAVISSIAAILIFVAVIQKISKDGHLFRN